MSTCPLRRAALRFPAGVALSSKAVPKPDADVSSGPPPDPDVCWTFRDWDDHAELLRPLVRGSGLLGIQAPDTPRGAALLFAAWREGRPAILLSHRLPPAELDALSARLQITQHVSGADTAPPPLDPDPPPVHLPSGPALILLTSGSSGRPRAVVHSIAALAASAAGSHANIPFGPGDVWLRSLSFHHVGGLAMLFRALHGGGAVAFPQPGEPLEVACRRLGATHLSVVATQLRWLLDAGPPPGLRALLVGGGPIPEDLVAEALAAGLPIHTTYGMTELGSQITTTPPGASPDRLRTAGRPLPGTEVRIAPDGEIQVRGATQFLGYLQDDGTLDPCRDAEGWFGTRDAGVLEPGGWLRVLGRRDQMFISGGENIHPEEIERALLASPGVAAAAVVPVPHPTWGARPAAFVRALPGIPLDAAGLQAALRARLEGFKVPDHIFPWPDDAPGWDGKPPRAWLTHRARELLGRA